MRLKPTMKIVSFSKLLLVVLVLSIGVVGCKKTPKGTTPIYGRGVTAPTSPNQPGPIENAGPRIGQDTGPEATRLPSNAEGTPLGARDSLDNYNQDREAFRQDTVYFDFDKYNVRPAELTKVQEVANYLKSQPAERVLIEGNCDERGTPEYNRALGERRALSVREALINSGIAGERVQTVSFGEDKPADTGHNEQAWAKNRRAEFVLLKPKAGASAEAR